MERSGSIEMLKHEIVRYLSYRDCKNLRLCCRQFAEGMDPVNLKIRTLVFTKRVYHLKPRSKNGDMEFKKPFQLTTRMRVSKINIYEYTCRSKNLNVILVPVDNLWPRMFASFKKRFEGPQVFKDSVAIALDIGSPKQIELRFTDHDYHWDIQEGSVPTKGTWCEIDWIESGYPQKRMSLNEVYIFILIMKGFTYSQRRDYWYCRPKLVLKEFY